MLTYQSQFEHVLKKLIAEQIAEVQNELAFGGGVENFAQYREKVGYIRGLASIVDLCITANEQIETI